MFRICFNSRGRQQVTDVTSVSPIIPSFPICRSGVFHSFILTPRTGDQARRCGLDAPLQLGQHGTPLAARRNRGQDLDHDPARALTKRRRPQIQAGIDGYRYQRHVQLAVERGDARLILAPARRPRCACLPGRSRIGRPCARALLARCDHALQCARAARTVDRDHAGLERVPAIERNPAELALHHHCRVVKDHRQRRRCPRPIDASSR